MAPVESESWPGPRTELTIDCRLLAHRSGATSAEDNGLTTMQHWQPRDATTLSDPEYQEHVLQGVSRTFALTIPQLPPALRDAVGNTYLLCRIADTIEDDPELEVTEKSRFARSLLAVVAGTAETGPWARELAGALSSRTPAAERDLIVNLPRVVRQAHALNHGARRTVLRCLETMTEGMSAFQARKSATGLPGIADVDRYCYHVAGVVGEMLTDLFAQHAPAISGRRTEMLPLAVSFGAGLQMTNILKDIWDDLERGACWLPGELFARHGVDLARLGRDPYDSRFGAALAEMIGLAHDHLRDGLRYTLMIPAGERGLRRFCLYALGMALMTLRLIHRHPDFRAGATVRISRAVVWAVVTASRAAAGHDRLLVWLFALAARGLPRPAAPAAIGA